MYEQYIILNVYLKDILGNEAMNLLNGKFLLDIPI